MIDKRVEAIGVDWVVARDIVTGEPMFAYGDGVLDRLEKYADA